MFSESACVNHKHHQRSSKLHLRSGINERQIKAVMYVKGRGTGKITNKEYQEVCNTSKRTASRDLLDLASSGIFEQIGTTRAGTAYVLKVPYRATMTP